MRLAVLDIGSNTVHLLVVDAHAGARPMPATTHKEVMRLAEHLDESGSITKSGAAKLLTFVQQSKQIAEDQGAEQLMAFATSAIREATNGPEILQHMAQETGLTLEVLSGTEEASLTFLAVRRWFGWASGKLLNFDIGGGSLEIAVGGEESPEAALSVPLGAGRMMRQFLPQERPSEGEVSALSVHARKVLGRVAGEITRHGRPDTVVASSKTFRSLARLANAGDSGEGPMPTQSLKRDQILHVIDRIRVLPVSEISNLSGVSSARAPQLLAGALVAHATMTVFDVPELVISPWALREGIILKKLDGLGV